MDRGESGACYRADGRLMSTVNFWTPLSAEFPVDPPPLFTVDAQGRFILGFDTAQDETCQFSFVAPSDIDLDGNQTVRIYYYMASATSGNIEFEVAVEAITDADALDLDSASSFASVVGTGATAVPGTQGNMDVATATLSVAAADSIAAGDLVRVRVNRNVGVASDAAGDCNVLAVEWRDNA